MKKKRFRLPNTLCVIPPSRGGRIENCLPEISVTVSDIKGWVWTKKPMTQPRAHDIVFLCVLIMKKWNWTYKAGFHDPPWLHQALDHPSTERIDGCTLYVASSKAVSLAYQHLCFRIGRFGEKVTGLWLEFKKAITYIGTSTAIL